MRYPDQCEDVAARVALTGRLLLAGLGVGALGGVLWGTAVCLRADGAAGYRDGILVLATMAGMVVGLLAAAVLACVVAALRRRQRG